MGLGDAERLIILGLLGYKKKGRGGSIKGSQINRTKHSHFSHHISSAPPLKETATKDVISMNWEVWLLWAFLVCSKKTANQGPNSFSWKCESVLVFVSHMEMPQTSPAPRSSAKGTFT